MTRSNLTMIAIVLCVVSWRPVSGQVAPLLKDESLVATNIKTLYAPENEMRAAAAKELRRIVAKYPSGTTNIRSKDGGQAFWTERVNQVVPGMTSAEVAKLLPAFAESPDGSGIGSGHSGSFRLDYNWVVRIAYNNLGKVIKRPTLTRRALSVYVAPPQDYTGIWICWYVNGQKAFEIEFRDGKYDGVFTSFHDNGQKSVEQHYVDHIADGSDTGWFPNGRVMYLYQNGKQDGRWIHFYPNGHQQSERNFRNGVEDGLSVEWYENGQLHFEMNYQNGGRHGIEAAWSEQGVLLYKREYREGKLVE